MDRPPSSTWLKRQAKSTQSTRLAQDARRVKLCLEALEDRTLLNATLSTVTAAPPPNSVLIVHQTDTLPMQVHQGVLVNSAVSAAISNGGSVKDAANGAASKVIIATAPPSVLGVEPGSTPSGTYGAGTTITILLVFTQSVTVTGTPQLALNSGGMANYTSGSGTSFLTFTYTVQAGDTTNGAALDYTGTGALSLNGGTINATGGTAALLTLPTPGSGFDDLPGVGIIINAASTSSPSPSPSPTALAQLQQEIRQIVSQLEGLLNGNLPLVLNGFSGFTSGYLTQQLQLTQSAVQIMEDTLFEFAAWQNEHQFFVVSTIPA